MESIDIISSPCSDSLQEMQKLHARERLFINIASTIVNGNHSNKASYCFLSNNSISYHLGAGISVSLQLVDGKWILMTTKVIDTEYAHLLTDEEMDTLTTLTKIQGNCALQLRLSFLNLFIMDIHSRIELSCISDMSELIAREVKQLAEDCHYTVQRIKEKYHGTKT